MKLLLLLLLLTSCAQLQRTSDSSNYRDRQRESYKKCMKELFNEGISEERSHLVCKDIYNNGIVNDPRN